MHMTQTFPNMTTRDIELAKSVQCSVAIRMEGRRALEPVREICINVACMATGE